MFRKHQPKEEGPRLVSTNEIDAYQLGADPKTEAPDFIGRELLNLSLERVHPWAADMYIQKALGLAFLAQAGDRMSELVCEEGLTLGRDGNGQVPEDVAHFAATMSRESARLLRDSNHLVIKKPIIEFIEDDALELTPDNQMPAWPLFTAPGAQELPYWQNYEESPRGLSMAFLRGSLRAAREAQNFVFDYQQILTDHPGDYPEHLQPIIDTVQQHFVGPAEIQLKAAEDLVLAAGSGELAPTPKAEAYELAHEAYVYMLMGGVALFCPRTMGPDWAR